MAKTCFSCKHMDVDCNEKPCVDCDDDGSNYVEGEKMLPSMRELLERAEKKGRADAIDELMDLLPDCDKIEIEHLICLIEKVKEKNNGDV